MWFLIILHINFGQLHVEERHFDTITDCLSEARNEMHEPQVQADFCTDGKLKWIKEP